MNKADAHLMEEVVEHMVLEKKDILHGDHFLPKDMPKDKVKPKVNKKSSGVWFYAIWLSIIFAELWYLDLYLSMKFPNFFNGWGF
jgi:hypothetical protein